MPRNKLNRFSISVSGKTYERLQASVDRGGVSRFIDDIVDSAFADPRILAKLVDRCRYGDDIGS